MTLATSGCCRVLLAEPTKEMYGLQICEAAEVPQRDHPPHLARLEKAGLARVHWEDASPGRKAALAAVITTGARGRRRAGPRCPGAGRPVRQASLAFVPGLPVVWHEHR